MQILANKRIVDQLLCKNTFQHQLFPMVLQKKCSLFIALSLLFFSLKVCSQSTGTIIGTVKSNKYSIEFATVILSDPNNKAKALHYTTTDSLGAFKFDKVNFGNYQLKLTMVGFKEFGKAIQLTNANPHLDIKDIILETDGKALDEVKIFAQKKLIRKTDEGFIVNATSDITQSGGTATDLLKNIPTIAVDGDGAVTLRGKTPLMLINGRNSKLSNPDQIPASSIESIEVINNASAKYDANAQSGIINIKLKKNKINGINGAIALGGGAGSKGRTANSLIVNYKTEKWNLGFDYDNRFAGRTKYISANRTNFDLPDAYQLDQVRNDERMERLQNLKFNVDFALDKKNIFALEAIRNLESQDNDETLRSSIYKQNKDFNSANTRHSLELQRAKIGEGAFYYTRKFDTPKKTLSASVTTSFETAKENTDITTQNLNQDASNIGTPFLQKTYNYENANVSNAIIDYTFPIFTKGIIEMGYKGTFRHTINNYGSLDKIDNNYVVNATSTSTFKFKENVEAFYVLYHSYFGTEDNPKWQYQIGVRGEQTNNNGSTIGNSTLFSNNYFKVFPTANLTYIVSPDEFWKISYGKRINRPDLNNLNPFVDITDALNPHSGNPYLKPEIIQAFELGYNKEWQKITFSGTVFYRHSENTIRNYLQPLTNAVVLRLPINIGTADSYGIESIIAAKLYKFYDCNLSFSLFQQTYNGGDSSTTIIQNSLNWYGKFINNFTIGKRGKLQIIGNYNSTITTPQGRLLPIYNVDLGFQQKLGKGNARLGIVVVDILNTLKSGSTAYTADFVSKRIQKADTRAIMITFVYSFKSTFKEKLLDNKFSKEF